MSVKLIGDPSGINMEVDATPKAGRVILYDAAGHAIASEIDADGHYQLQSVLTQHVIISTKNSSIANIGSLGTWSGQSESSLGVAGIQVTVKCSKRVTVTVFQSIDNSGSWDNTASYSIPAGFGSARTHQATGAYYKVTIQNMEAAESTARIGTALCPVIECLPRTLSSGGNLRVTPSAEWQNSNRTLGIYVTSSFRTLGDTVATQNILSIANPLGSVCIVAVRSLNFMSETLVALLTIASQVKSCRSTNTPSGGTVIVPVKYQTCFPDCTAIVRGATASDGGGATAITATAGATLWGQFLDRPATAVGNIQHLNYNLIPDVGADLRQILLYPGEALLVQTVGAIPATTHMVVNVGWMEMMY